MKARQGKKRLSGHSKRSSRRNPLGLRGQRSGLSRLIFRFNLRELSVYFALIPKFASGVFRIVIRQSGKQLAISIARLKFFGPQHQFPPRRPREKISGLQGNVSFSVGEHDSRTPLGTPTVKSSKSLKQPETAASKLEVLIKNYGDAFCFTRKIQSI